MAKYRTTSKLLTTALQGAADANRDVVAADIHGGGFVRVYFKDPQTMGNLLKVETTCDDIFEEQSG
jgi:hypothetical protein